jgi:hypothetical protein
MHDSSQNPESESELRDIEALLRQVAPAPSQLDERELFYQAGYAAQRGFVPLTIAEKKNSPSSRTLIYSFGGGLGVGIAASWFMFLLSTAAMAPQMERETNQQIVQSPQDALQSDVPIPGPAAAATPNISGPVLPLDWNENSIRTVVYRGNRRAIWGTRDSSGQDNEAAKMSESDEPSAKQIDNLKWRRTSEDSWLD